MPVKLIHTAGVNLDIVPQAAGKAPGALHVARELGIRRSRIVVAGDSGNDIDMFETIEKGIAVGNADPELVAGVRGARRKGVYFASRPHAGGILQGLVHFGAMPAGGAAGAGVAPGGLHHVRRA
jgi:mannosylfructose-6-phosphate phosphatase